MIICSRCKYFTQSVSVIHYRNTMQRRKFTITLDSRRPVAHMWDLYADIRNYPQRITFVKNVVLPEGIRVGALWYDTTTILLIPMKIPHIIVAWDEKRRIVYEMQLPLGGSMKHVYTLTPSKTGTKLSADIEFFLGNQVVHFLLGPLLEKRLRHMLTSSYEKSEKRGMTQKEANILQ